MNMASIQIRSGIKIGFDELVIGMSQLPSHELTQLLELLQQTISGKQQLTPIEQEIVLLRQIRGMIPATKVRRLKALQKKQHEQTLSALEQEEMRLISDFIEQKSAERIALLSQLAALRQITIRELVKQLNLKTFYG